MVFLILLSVFLALPISTLIWQYSPLPRFIQFPWRFLALTTFFLAVFASRLPKKLGILVAILIIISSMPFLKVDRTFHPESFYTTNDDSTTVKNEYMPKWVKTDPTNRPPIPTTIYFPGVKVVVNGQEVEPEINNNGVIITPGKIVFRETPLHIFADLLIILGIIIILTSWFSKTVWPGTKKGYCLGK